MASKFTIDDNSLEFWCMCYAFDAGAYEELEYDDEEYYEKFVELYKKYAEPLKIRDGFTV